MSDGRLGADQPDMSEIMELFVIGLPCGKRNGRNLSPCNEGTETIIPRRRLW